MQIRTTLQKQWRFTFLVVFFNVLIIHKALCEYSNCLLVLPPSNVAMRRDVQEGQARCLCRLGRHKEALDIAEKLRNGATNTDHLTTVLNLQFAIYQGLENVEEKITCLQQLICLHPFNPWYWKLLAESYMSLLQSLSPLAIPETNLNQSEEVSVSDSTVKEFPCTSEELERMDEVKRTASESWEQNMSKRLNVFLDYSVPFFNCLFHFRLLLQLIQLQQSSFALENNIKGQKEIDDKVARLGFNENSLLLMTKVRGCFIVCKFSAIHRLVEVPEPVQAQSPVSDTPLS
uniref:Uncharacterized protein n=1 Tax=Accipiter nisus TaxID=211598 RepID=A0A8B9NIC8_9AVES